MHRDRQSQARDPRAIFHRAGRDARRLSWVAGAGGVLAGLVAAIAWQRLSLLPTNLTDATAAGLLGLTFGLAATELYALMLGPRRTAALETMWTYAYGENARFLRLAGPRAGIPGRARAWLRTAPDTPETRLARTWIGTWLGGPRPSREAIAEISVETPLDGVRRALLLWLADWATGADPDLAAIRAAVAVLDDPRERAHGAAGLAFAEARLAADSGADPIEPLARVRPLLGTIPRRATLAWRRSLGRGGAVALGLLLAFVEMAAATVR